MTNPGVLGSRALRGSMVNLAFHPYEGNQMDTRISWALSG